MWYVCIYTVSISFLLIPPLSRLHHIFIEKEKFFSLYTPLGVDCCCCYVTFKYAQRRWYVDDQSHYRAKRNKISGKPRVSSNKKVVNVYDKNEEFLHILNFFRICVDNTKNFAWSAYILGLLDIRVTSLRNELVQWRFYVHYQHDVARDFRSFGYSINHSFPLNLF
jgi:hypothetical protein